MTTDRLPTATILGVHVHAVTNTQTLTLIEQFIASGQPHQLCTVNPEFVVAAQADSEFRQIINNDRYIKLQWLMIRSGRGSQKHVVV